MACPSSFDSTLSSSLSLSSSSSRALTYYVVAIVTSLDAPPPLLLRRRLYRHAAATIAALTPVSLRLSRASGWLLHRHLSRRASASLVVSAPLSLRRHLSCCAAASLVAPHLRRVVVALPTILTCHRLSCRAGWLSPCYLSLCAAVSLFATSLIAPQSLWVIGPLNPSKKSIGLLRGLLLSIRHSGTGRKASCGRSRAISAGGGRGGDVCSWPLVHVSTYLLLE